ncbi:MAG: hypothetical protein IPG46_06590 [Actinobacteria bacterium]|nr:hypothetical protein [Actinomycetota bacterium]
MSFANTFVVTASPIRTTALSSRARGGRLMPSASVTYTHSWPVATFTPSVRVYSTRTGSVIRRVAEILTAR